MIKKSVYINIPSKISKEIGIAKGSILYVTLEVDRVVLSKEQDEKVVTNHTSMLDTEGKPDNYTGGKANLKRMLEEDYW
ncbi:MAG: hypothetical protein ACREBI_02000 [Nitrosotalea sp.]